ncbi:MAG: peptidase C39 family protein [Nocardioidaceae bacterium]
MRTRGLVLASVLLFSVPMTARAVPEQSPGPPFTATAGSDGRALAPSLRSLTALRVLARQTLPTKQIALTRWRGKTVRTGRFARSHFEGGVQIGPRPVRVSYDDPYGPGGPRAYDRGFWYSPWAKPGFGFDQLIASYNASTPVGTFIEVAARGRTAGGRLSSWDSLGRWARHDKRFHRMTLAAQPDDFTHVAVDTLVTDHGSRLTRWQLRVTLMRRTGSGKTPTVTMIAAVASRLPSASGTSRPGPAVGRSLAAPRYSQQIHAGEYPRYDGGGEAWCSPTSTSMVLAYWHRGPTPKQYSWVNTSYDDPWVDYAARFTYASGYDGTGDWPFNTAYAGRFKLDTFVTRLRSLREAELFIRAGIPLVASISFGPGELDGAPINSTSGHLLVIRGFTGSGKVIVNDPAAATSKGVRRVYKRGQFENAWSDNGGVVYVVHPASKPLPQPRRHRNW